MNALRMTILGIIVVLTVAIFSVWQWKVKHNVAGKPQVQVETRWGEAAPVQKAEPKKPEVKTPSLPVEEITAPRSYKQALDFSKKTNKPLFLYFSSDRCEYCGKMIKETLNNSKVKALLADYIVYVLNVDGPEGYVATEAKIDMVPYYLVCDGDRKISKVGVGYKGPTTFISWLQ